VDLDLVGEVLGDEPTEPLGPRLWRWLRGHPLALVLIVVLVLAVAGVGVVIVTRPVQPAAVTLVQGDNFDESSNEPRWLEQADGRPSGSVGLTIKAVLQRAEAGAGVDTDVVGITGPGVSGIANAPTAVPRAGPVEVPLKVSLDCEHLPDALPANAYRLRIRARSADSLRRPADRLVGLAELSQRWATAVEFTCAAWSARKDLTVTALTAKVDPSKPRIAMTFTVVNRGDRPASLEQAIPGYSIRIEGKLPVRVPAHSTATAAVTVVLDTCDSVKPSEDGLYSLGRGPALTTAFNVAGRSGEIPAGGGTFPGKLSAQNPDLEAFGSTGVLIATDPARTLREALDRACASLRPMLVLLPPGGLRYDARTRVLTVPVRFLVGAAVPVRSVRLRSRPDGTATGLAAPGSAAYTPLWKPTGALKPDDTGQLQVDLRYRAPKGRSCPERGGYLPDIVATLDVLVARHSREVSYSGTPNLFDDPKMLAVLCGRD
jgi:hypothetical protein